MSLSGACKLTVPAVPVLTNDWLNIMLGLASGTASTDKGFKLGGSRFPDSIMLPCLLVSVIFPADPESDKRTEPMVELFNSIFLFAVKVISPALLVGESIPGGAGTPFTFVSI